MTTYVVKAVSEIDNSIVEEYEYFDEITARGNAMRMRDNDKYALCHIILEAKKDGVVLRSIQN